MSVAHLGACGAAGASAAAEANPSANRDIVSAIEEGGATKRTGSLGATGTAAAFPPPRRAPTAAPGPFFSPRRACKRPRRMAKAVPASSTAAPGGVPVTLLREILETSPAPAARVALRVFAGLERDPLPSKRQSLSNSLPAHFVTTRLSLDAGLVELIAAFPADGAAAGASDAGSGGGDVIAIGSSSSSSSAGSSLGPSASAVGAPADARFFGGGGGRRGGRGGSAGPGSVAASALLAGSQAALQHAQRKAAEKLLKHATRDPWEPSSNRSKFRGVWRLQEGQWTVKVEGLHKDDFPTREKAERAFLEHAARAGVTEEALLYRPGAAEACAPPAAKRPKA